MSAGDGSRPFDLLALDLDGTLLTSQKRLDPADVEAVRAAAARGVRIVLTTARPPRSTLPIARALGLLDDPGRHDTSIHYNGALTWDLAANAPIAHLPLEPALTHEVVAEARRVDGDVLVWVEIMDRWCTDRPVVYGPNQPIGTETSKSHGPDHVGPFETFLHEPATKVMFLAQPARLAPVFERVRMVFASSGRLACRVSDAHLFSVCASGADKGTALATLASGLGIARERVLAIGDAPNDAGMLAWAGVGVAVANAWEEARRSADEVAPETNDERAVSRALQRHGVV